METIRAGVVGVGHLGYHHARHYAALPGVELVGVADPDGANRTRAAEEFTVPGFSEAAGLLEMGLDAMSVVTPAGTHHDVVLPLLQAGVHVLVEKPIATTPLEGETMVAVAKAHGCLLQVGHLERFNGAVVALAEAVRSPRFIECHRMSPYPMRSLDVSVVLDLMIHDLDVVLSLVPSPVEMLDATGVAVFSEAEDIASVRLRFACGCVANLTASRVSMERVRKIRVFEERAYLSADYMEQTVRVYRKGDGAAGGNPMDRIEVSTLAVERTDPLQRELASFIDCVRTGRAPLVPGEEGVRALDLAQRVTDFIRTHR